MEQGAYEAASLAFEDALDQDSTDAEVLLKIAECDARLGQIPASMSHLWRFLRHHPRDARGWAILGVLYEAQGDSVASDSCYRAAGNLNPEVLKAVGLDRGGR
jgi:Flp pilus assembly protein TadD